MHKQIYYIHHKAILFVGVDCSGDALSEINSKQKATLLGELAYTSEFLLLTLIL